jgi:hypothetical protein
LFGNREFYIAKAKPSARPIGRGSAYLLQWALRGAPNKGALGSRLFLVLTKPKTMKGKTMIRRVGSNTLGILVVLLAAFSAKAQDILFTNKTATFTNLEGRLFKNVEIIRADRDGVIWRDGATSGGRVGYTNLDALFLASWGIPTNRIEEARARAEHWAASNAAATRAWASAEARAELMGKIERYVASATFEIDGRLIQALKGGNALVHLQSWRHPIQESTDPEAGRWKDTSETIWLMNYHGETVDDSEVVCTAYAIGQKKYEAVLGAQKRVLRYTTSRSQAVDYLEWLNGLGPRPDWVDPTEQKP